MSLITLFATIHIIGAITIIIIHCKNGSASKYGDGVRFARPSDILSTDCAAWEVLWLIRTIDNVDYYINKKIEKYFMDEREIS